MREEQQPMSMFLKLNLSFNASMDRACPASYFPKHVAKATRPPFNANNVTTSPAWRRKWMMVGSWTHIDPQLRGDEDVGGEEDEQFEGPEQESQLGYNPQISSSNYDAHLDHARQSKKQLLQRRFENIFAKYGRDFEGVGDEIEMETGLIVVDNGHLKNMLHEGDPGYDEAAEFANPPVSGPDTAIVGGIDHNMAADSESDEESEEEAVNEVFSAPGYSDESNTTPFETEDSSEEVEKVFAIDPALDNGQSTTSQRVTRSRTHKRKRPVVEEDLEDQTAATAKPHDLSEHLESLKASMLDLQSKHNQGHEVDHNDIEALGLSIARQLADFVNRDKASSRPQWNNAKDPTWSYPELPKVQYQQTEQRRIRIRSPSPLPIFTGPSPGQKSLWAPIQHPQARKKYKRRKTNADPDQVEADKSSSPVSTNPGPVETDAEGEAESSEALAKKCVNCQCTSSLIWRSGPDGTLCNACGMYYYRYGLIRPLAPPSDTEESDDEDVSHFDPEDLNTADDTIVDQVIPNLLGRGRYKGGRFTLEDDAMLIKLKEIDQLSWERIAKQFPGRTAYGVQCRYSKKLNNRAIEARALLVNQGYESRHDENGVVIFAPAPQQIKAWTDDEDDLLLKLRDEDKLEWDIIAQSFPGRNARAMERRFAHVARQLTKQNSNFRKKKKKQPKKSKGPLARMCTKYTTEEDDHLIYLREIEKLSWADIALRLPGRNAMAMQKRYVRELAYRNQELGADPLVEDEHGNLRPTRSKHARFTREEDIDLLHLRNDLGLSWKEIEFKMPGRKWESLENRYQYITKGFTRYMKRKGEEAASNADATKLRENADDADGRQSEDELMRDKEDQSTIAPCAGPSTQADNRNGVLNKEIEEDENPSPQGHGFFSEGDVPFTTEEDILIRQLRELEKLSWDAIATKLPGRNVAAISGRYYRHLFPKSEAVNPWSRATPVSSFVEAKPLEIASRINLASSEIASRRALRWTKEESDLVRRYFDQGLDFEAIGEKMPWRTHTAIQHHYTTKLSIKKSTGKLVAPTLKDSLLRQAVANTTRHSMPAESTVIDLTADDGDDESPSQNGKQLRKLLPRPAPSDERARMLRKYAPGLCTPTRVLSAPVSSPLPHAHPPKTPGVEAYASLLSQYLSGRDSPDDNGHNTSSTKNPLTPSRPQQHSQPSTTPTIDKAADTINYFTPAAHNIHSHPYFVPPPDGNNRHVPLFSEHGLSTQRSVIDPRLLEGKLMAPPRPLKLSRHAAELITRLQSTIPVLKEAAIDSLSEETSKNDDEPMFVDLTGPENDMLINDDDEQFIFAEDSALEDVHVYEGGSLGNDEHVVLLQNEHGSVPKSDHVVQTHPADGMVDGVYRAEDDEASAFNDEALDIGEVTTPNAENYTPVNDNLNPALVEDDAETDDKPDILSPLAVQTSMHDSGFFDGPADSAKDGVEIETSVEDSEENLEIGLPVATPPPHSWNELLVMAFDMNGDARSMNVKDICKFIENRFPYYKNNTSAWRDGVQACLDDKPEFVKMSRSRPLWVFKKALQCTELEKTVQPNNDGPAPEAEQLAEFGAMIASEIDEPVDEPVRLITVRSLRQRPPKPEQVEPVKKAPGHPRKASQKYDGADAKELHSSVQEQAPVADIADDVDELAPSPEKLGPTRASLDLVSASSTLPPLNDFERLHAPVHHHRNADINKNLHGHPQASSTHNKLFVATSAFQDATRNISTLESSVVTSSSPLTSLKTPGTAYSTADTPDTSYSTLFGLGRPQHRGVAALRSSIAPEYARSRSSSVALPNSRKRVVYTPVREIEGDEDELG